MTGQSRPHQTQRLELQVMTLACSEACDWAHLGDVHDCFVCAHIGQAAQVGILESLLGDRQP